MKWVLLVWTMWTVDGATTIPVKKAELFFPDQQACLDAMIVLEEKYAPYSEEGFGYTLQCRKREE